MTDIIVVLLLIILFGSIVRYLFKQKQKGCSVSCSSCPIVHSCDKETIIQDLRKIIHD